MAKSKTAAIGRIDRRIIFALIFLAVAWPLIQPMRLPIDVSPPVQGIYDAVEAVPEGSIVMLAGDYSPDTMPELQPMVETFIRHAFEKDLRLVVACLWPASPPLVEAALNPLAEEYGKDYGVDYVNLGYMAGGTVTLLGMGASIPNTFPSDYGGTPVRELPIMRDVRNFDDIAMVMEVSAGTPGTREWVQQVQSRFQVTLGSGTTAVGAPNFYPYVQSKQLVGLLGGLKGAAEYETLIGAPGDATSGMDAQSIVHAMIVVFILLGNLAYFISGRRRASERAA
ncbi:MAG: hypothetical protein GF400_07880 [Candidatus Eisenbacteria bacterium]|nr:hypothetical protein [Candidatus Eisenbacteria bacterium]